MTQWEELSLRAQPSTWLFEGRMVVVGFASGEMSTMKMNRLMLKNISLLGVHWSRYLEEKPQVIQDTQEGIYQLFLEGKVKPVICDVLPLKEASRALLTLQSRKTFGKILLHP